MNRRALLTQGALAAVGLGVGPVRAAAQSRRTAPHVHRYATLGRTGMKISDISFGSSRLNGNDEDTVRYAFDQGINYFDTADSYGSESAIGGALRGKRDRVYLASKTETSPSDRRESMMRALEGTLGQLRTDYVDVYFNHAVN